MDNGKENTGAVFVREINLYEKETERLKVLNQICLELLQLPYDCLHKELNIHVIIRMGSEIIKTF